MSQSDDSDTAIFYGPITEEEIAWRKRKGYSFGSSDSEEETNISDSDSKNNLNDSDYIDLNNTFEEMKMFYKYGPEYEKICEEKKKKKKEMMDSVTKSPCKLANDKENINSGAETDGTTPKSNKISSDAVNKGMKCFSTPQFPLSAIKNRNLDSPHLKFSNIISPVAAYIYEHPVPKTPNRLPHRKVNKPVTLPKSHTYSTAKKILRKSVTQSNKSKKKTYAILVSSKEPELKVPCGPKMMELIHKKKEELQFVGRAKVKAELARNSSCGNTTMEISLYEKPEPKYENTLKAIKSSRY